MEKPPIERWRERFQAALVLAAIWAGWPFLDLLREGFGSPVAGQLFYEILGRGLLVFMGAGAAAYAFQAIFGDGKPGQNISSTK